MTVASIGIEFWSPLQFSFYLKKEIEVKVIRKAWSDNTVSFSVQRTVQRELWRQKQDIFITILSNMYENFPWAEFNNQSWAKKSTGNIFSNFYVKIDTMRHQITRLHLVGASDTSFDLFFI